MESSSAENAKTTAESAQERDFYKTQFETSRDRVRELQQLLELEKVGPVIFGDTKLKFRKYVAK